MKLLKKIFSKRFILFFLVFVFSLGIFLRGGTQVGAVATTTAGNISATQNQSFINALQSPNTTMESWVVGKELVGIPQAGMLPIIMRGITGYLWGVYNPDGTPVSLGAMGIFEQLIGGLYSNQPVSSKTYFTYLAENIGVSPKPTYALAKNGTEFIQPVLALWQKMRDVAYIFFVVIFVAVGFMIMFRFKVNPQTVASVQDALPRIVVSLLLVTLSFAIAGFIVDLVFLGNALMGSIFKTTPITTWVEADKIDIGTLFSQWGGPQDFKVEVFGQKIVTLTCGVRLLCLIGSKLATGIPSLLSGQVSDIVDVVLALVVIATIFKIFFALLTKYVSIYIYTIFAPLAFLWGALPGQEDTGGKLIKGLISSALTFPAVYFLMNLALFFVQKAFVPSIDALPPFSLGAGTLQTLQGNVVGAYQGLIALGVLMAAAGAPQAIDDLLAVKGGAGMGAAEGIAGAVRKLPIIGSFLG